jgi:hypothetical protein
VATVTFGNDAAEILEILDRFYSSDQWLDEALGVVFGVACM